MGKKTLPSDAIGDNVSLSAYSDGLAGLPERLVSSEDIEAFGLPWCIHSTGIPRVRGPLLINLDLNPRGSGTHWVLLYSAEKFRYWFDPIGFAGFPVRAVAEDVRGPPLYYNETPYQPHRSNLCGHFSIALALRLRRSQPQKIADLVKCVRDLFGDEPGPADLFAIARELSRH